MTESEPLVEIHGVTSRQVDFWVRQGYLLPGQPAPASGNARQWPEEEIRVAQLMARLVACGFTPADACDYARKVLGRRGSPVRLTLARGVVLEVEGP